MASRSTFAASDDLIEPFCLFLENDGRSPVTVMNYRCDLEGLVRWSESRNRRAFDLRYFAANDVEPYRDFLISKFKATTTNRKLAVLKVFLSWGGRLLGLVEIPRIPNVKLLPRPKSHLPYLSPSDQAELLRCVEARGETQDVAVIKLMLHTGIRVSELCALRWKNVKIADRKGTLTLYSSKRAKFVEVPLNTPSRNALARLRSSREPKASEMVFTGRSGPMTRRGVVMLLNRYSKIAKLKSLTPGALRQSFCMNLVSLGVTPYIISRLMARGSWEPTLFYFAQLPQKIVRELELEAVERLKEI